jgi:hypothetical protein
MDVCRLLVTSLADVGATNRSKRFVLNVSSDHLTVFALFNSRCSDGMTALMHAYTHSDVASYLRVVGSPPPAVVDSPCGSARGAVEESIMRESIKRGDKSNCHLR